MTSLFRELVSVPTEPCFSIKTVDAPSLCCSLRAMARPTTPPPITAWVKSAFRRMLDEKCLELEGVVVLCKEARVSMRNEAMTGAEAEIVKLGVLFYETDSNAITKLSQTDDGNRSGLWV